MTNREKARVVWDCFRTVIAGINLIFYFLFFLAYVLSGDLKYGVDSALSGVTFLILIPREILE